jgi:hypothetical protein
MYDNGQNSGSNAYYSGWDMKVWCQRYPVKSRFCYLKSDSGNFQADCQRRMNAALYYNPWWPTHIWICINLWVLGMFYF